MPPPSILFFLHRFSISTTVQKMDSNQAIPWELKEMVSDTVSSRLNEVRTVIVMVSSKLPDVPDSYALTASLYILIAK